MDRFFLFCFRSCLKGDNDKEYYDVLDISDPSQATAEIVKRQYKKLSLTLHPDKLSQKGIEVTQEHKQHFLKLKEAYDVLSDPKRKKIYDEYGLSGLKLLENPADMNHLDLLRNFQKNRGDRTTLGLFIALIFAAVLLLPILFALKCDGTLGTEAPWVAIWSPMWLVDLFLLISAVAVLFDQGDTDEENEEHDEDHPEVKKHANKIPIHEKIYQFLVTILFLLSQIFILIRLDKYTSWAWFAVFSPWFIYEGINVLYHVHGAFFVKLTPPNPENEPFKVDEGGEGIEEQFMKKIKEDMKYFEEELEQDRCRKAVFGFTLRAWQAVFLALQLDQWVQWNWGLVFLPMWIYLFTQYIYVYIFQSWGAKKLEGLDVERIMAQDVQDPSEISRYQQGTTLQSQASLVCYGQLVFVFMAIMLVCRLQESHYSTFFIILPVFLFLGSCCCIVFCGITCLSIVDTDGLEEEIHKQQQGGASGAGAGEGEKKNGDVEADGSGEGNTTTEGGVPLVAPGEYGTFGAPKANESYTSPLQAERSIEVTSIIIEESATNEVVKLDEKKAATTIDPDID